MTLVASKKEIAGIEDNIHRLNDLESEMVKYDQIDISVKHYFAPGVYCREMFLPKGVMLTGKIHKHSHMNIMSKGDVTFVNEEGRHRVQAPYSFVSEAGTKRAFFAHEDTVWTTIHATEETDLDKIEEELIAESLKDLEDT